MKQLWLFDQKNTSPPILSTQPKATSIQQSSHTRVNTILKQKACIVIGKDKYVIWYPKDALKYNDHGDLVCINMKIRKENQKAYSQFVLNISWFEKYTHTERSTGDTATRVNFVINSICKTDRYSGWTAFGGRRGDACSSPIRSFNYFRGLFPWASSRGSISNNAHHEMILELKRFLLSV